MSVKELAEWSGNKSLAKNKKRWCQKHLVKYADYEDKYGGVIIIKIHQPVFFSSAYTEIKDKYYNYYGHDNIKVDTAKNCYRKLRPNMINQNIQEQTGAAYVGRARREDYGTACRDKRIGSKGFCHFVFGKLVDDDFEFFTEEEEKLKQQIFAEMYQKTSYDCEQQRQALTWALKHQEITQEEYIENMLQLIEEDTNWVDFQNKLEEKLNCRVGFRIMIEQCAFEMINEEYIF